MAVKRPTNLEELFAFYYEDFKPLYCQLQSLNTPPLEMFFEINAAFDHLSRHWYYKLSESEAVSATCAHLKRGCFDAFKIIVRQMGFYRCRLRETTLAAVPHLAAAAFLAMAFRFPALSD